MTKPQLPPAPHVIGDVSMYPERMVLELLKAEREECATICELGANKPDSAVNRALLEAAAVIRARDGDHE